ncbi:MAG: MoaD/ThiS family protein [Pseudomonadota bacterium]
MTDTQPNTTIRYFAWVRTRLNRAEDDVTIPAAGMRLQDLAIMLQEQSTSHAVIFGRPEALKAAINKQYADLSALVMPGDEVAFFPPVTGG